MSDIRYNSWLHRSGTGGVYQDSSGKVGIGTSVPAGTGLHVKEGYSGLSAPNANADSIFIENSANAGVTIATPNTNTGYLIFADPEDDNIGQIIYRHGGSNANSMGFFVNAAERLRIDSDGRMMVGNTAAANMFTVANNLVVGSGSGSEGMTIYSDSTNDGYICFADGTGDPAYRMGQIIYSHQSNKLQFRTNGNTDRLIIDNAGNVNISGVTTATAFVPSAGQLGRKNMIINGDCRVAQRGTSVTTGTGNFAAYTLDQWKVSAYATDQLNLTVTQEAMNQAIPGLANFIKVSPNAAESGGAADEYTHLRQTIEAKDCQKLKWGTASAESATLSFWVKSNTTGTACINFNKHDATSYYITRTYTINAADTWEYKTVTIPGNTASGIANDTGIGINIYWFLDAGSNYKTTDSTSWVTAADGKYAYGHNINLIDSTSDYLALAGVQFEVGTVDTPFEHLTYTEELALCQRYYQQWKRGYLAANSVGTSDINIGIPLTVPLRAAPSIAALDMHRSGNKTATVSIVSVEYSDVNSIILEVRVGGWTGGNQVVDEVAYVLIPSGDTMKISAEL